MLPSLNVAYSDKGRLGNNKELLNCYSAPAFVLNPLLFNLVTFVDALFDYGTPLTFHSGHFDIFLQDW